MGTKVEFLGILWEVEFHPSRLEKVDFVGKKVDLTRGLFDQV